MPCSMDTGVPFLPTDPAQRTVMLRGTADQIAMAEWLLHELDEASRRPNELPSAPREPMSGFLDHNVYNGGTTDRLHLTWQRSRF